MNWARYCFGDPWTFVWGSENKNHSTLRQTIAFKSAIHHLISPSPSWDTPPTRWLGPTQQGVGLGRAPCHCVWRWRLIMRESFGCTEPAFRQSGASNPRQPHSPLITGESINELLQQCQKSRFWHLDVHWGSKNKIHSTLRQKIAYKPGIHHPISPSASSEILPPQGGLVPHSQPAAGGPWQYTLPLCREVKAGNDRPRGGRPEPAFGK